MRIGFVGAGGIANHHLNVLKGIEGAELVAFYDPATERAEATAARFGGTAYDTLETFFDQGQPQAVYICVPPHQHGPAEREACERGIPLFIEKPVSNSLAQARELNAAFSAKQLITSVGYHFRYFDLTETARQHLNSAQVGMVLGYWVGGLPGAPWWRKMSESGGQLVEQTTHLFDLARYLVGEVESVYAATALRGLAEVPDLDVPDVGTVTLRFQSGAIGCIANSCMVSQGYSAFGLHILAKDLVLEHSGGSLKVTTPKGSLEFAAKVNPYQQEDQVFLSAVQTGDSSHIRSPYEDAVKSLAISLAANESARTGEVVPLKTFSHR